MRDGNDWLLASFGEIYPAHVSAFAELLIVLRQQFDGDLDAMLILAVIGDRRVWQRLPSAAVSYEGMGRSALPEAHSVSINVLSIAEFTGMPRETVRRKVGSLIDRGWVEREENGDLRPTQKAARDLQSGTDATVTYIRTLADACDRARGRNGTGNGAAVAD